MKPASRGGGVSPACSQASDNAVRRVNLRVIAKRIVPWTSNLGILLRAVTLHAPRVSVNVAKYRTPGGGGHIPVVDGASAPSLSSTDAAPSPVPFNAFPGKRSTASSDALAPQCHRTAQASSGACWRQSLPDASSARSLRQASPRPTLGRAAHMARPITPQDILLFPYMSPLDADMMHCYSTDSGEMLESPDGRARNLWGACMSEPIMHPARCGEFSDAYRRSMLRSGPT